MANSELFVKCYIDFLENKLLTYSEKMVYLALKQRLDFGADCGIVHPSLKSVAKVLGISEARACRIVASLSLKGVIKKKCRTLGCRNEYTIYDYPSLWACTTLEELKRQGDKLYSLGSFETYKEKYNDIMARLDREGYSCTFTESGFNPTVKKIRKDNVSIDNFEFGAVSSFLKERIFVRCYFDFLSSKLLSISEKMVFLGLKRFLSVKKDDGQVFPSIKRLSSMLFMCIEKVVNVLAALDRKHFIVKKRNGFKKNNTYIIADGPSVWAVSQPKIKKNAEPSEFSLDNELNAMRDILSACNDFGYKLNLSVNSSFESVDDNTGLVESRPFLLSEVKKTVRLKKCSKAKNKKSSSKYDLDALKDIFDYNVLCSIRTQSEADVIMNILYDLLNSKERKIKVDGRFVPHSEYVDKVLNLNYEELDYAMELYQSVNKPISDPVAYFRRVLYDIKERYFLYIQNKIAQSY